MWGAQVSMLGAPDLLRALLAEFLLSLPVALHSFSFPRLVILSKS